MKIEFENINPNLEILEYVIREVENDTYLNETQHKQPHFQARIKASEDFDCDGNVKCVLSYYDANNKFLGLDEGSIWTHDSDEHDPIPLSKPIEVPADTAHAVFRFNHRETTSGFYHWAGMIATFMALMLLASWLMDAFGILK